MDHTFETPAPPNLRVEIGSGLVEVMAGETGGRTLVTVTGKGAEETRVEQQGSTIAIIGPRTRSGFSISFGNDSRLHVRVSAPSGSSLSTKLGSADLLATGLLGTASLTSGSGDLRADDIGTLEATTGSGDLVIRSVTGNAATRSGSGDVRIGHTTGDVSTISGSGDVLLGTVEGKLSAKSGSGDVRVEVSGHGAGITTASGDVGVGLLSSGGVEARTASGDISVGVAAGLPAWTDIHTLTGDVTSALQSLGQPAEGDPFVELRLRSVSGDISVRHLADDQPQPSPTPQN